jgi:hypothetical protein
VPEQVAVVSSSEEQVADEGDEKFVPSRIIPPFCSPGLGIAAGQFSLPPLAVGLFIIDSSNLSFKRSWDGLTKAQDQCLFPRCLGCIVDQIGRLPPCHRHDHHHDRGRGRCS